MKHRGMKRRIAVLFDAIEDDYQAEILRGIALEAARSNVTLICLAGGVLGDARSSAHARNFLFDIFDPSTVDGILILSAALGNGVGAERFAEWIERFRGTPLVNLGLEVPGFDGFEVDGGVAMKSLVDHVIRVHEKKRVAFVRGPVTSHDAEQRFEAYRAALSDHGIPFDPNLVVQGTWLRESGALAVHELLDVRNVHLRGIGAIVCANDYMALGALDALRQRGLAIPHDVVLTGFDDLRIVRTAVPPLTTVRQPSGRLGSEGLKRLLAQLARPEAPAAPRLPAELVERASCGCRGVHTSIVNRAKRPGSSLHTNLLDRRSLIAAELSRAARGLLQGVGSGWEERLLNAFLADLTGSTQGSFAGALERMITKLPLSQTEMSVFHLLLDVLRDSVRGAMDADIAATQRAADLLDGARQYVGDTVSRAEYFRSAETTHYLREMAGIAGSFLSPADLSETRAAREAKLEAIGQANFVLGVFTEPGRTTTACRVAAALFHGKAVSAHSFSAAAFAPPSFVEESEGPLLVQPLYYEGEPLGVMTFPLGHLDGPVYEQASEILSLGLKSYWLAHPPHPFGTKPSEAPEVLVPAGPRRLAG